LFGSNIQKFKSEEKAVTSLVTHKKMVVCAVCLLRTLLRSYNISGGHLISQFSS